LAVTKSDLADEELIAEIKKDLPDLPSVFISSKTGYNLQSLKDILWTELNTP
jgi:GTP-binding protein